MRLPDGEPNDEPLLDQTSPSRRRIVSEPIQAAHHADSRRTVTSATAEHEESSSGRRSAAIAGFERASHLVPLADPMDDAKDAGDAILYERASTCARVRGRIAALLVTFAIELIPAFAISEGGEALTSVIGSDAFELFAGFLPLTSAIAGNVGLQCSVVTCRALERGFIRQADQAQVLWRELRCCLGLGAIVASFACATASLWFYLVIEERAPAPNAEPGYGALTATAGSGCGPFRTGETCGMCELMRVCRDAAVASGGGALVADPSCTRCVPLAAARPGAAASAEAPGAHWHASAHYDAEAPGAHWHASAHYDAEAPGVHWHASAHYDAEAPGPHWQHALLFGLCIGAAQLLGTCTACLGGTVAPLLFHFHLKQDPGMWAGPLETCLQDVVTSAALVTISAGVLACVW